MTFREHVAAVALGLVPGDQFPDIATAGLVEGYDSASLAVLAGQSSAGYDSCEWRRLWAAALDELGLTSPAPLDAATMVVRAYARMVTAGELAPRKGAEMLVHVHRAVHEAAPDSRFVGDSIGAAAIIGLFYQHDDCGFLGTPTHEQIDAEILDEFRRIVSRSAV